MRFAPAPDALDLETNEVTLRSETLHEHIGRELGAVPEDLVGLPIPEVPEGTSLPAHAAELERKLAALGPVNPLALEELSTLEERHKELEVPGRRRAGRPAGAARGRAHAGPRDHDLVRRRRGRRQRALLHPGGAAVPRRDRAAWC